MITSLQKKARGNRVALGSWKRAYFDKIRRLLAEGTHTEELHEPNRAKGSSTQFQLTNGASIDGAGQWWAHRTQKQRTLQPWSALMEQAWMKKLSNGRNTQFATAKATTEQVDAKHPTPKVASTIPATVV